MKRSSRSAVALPCSRWWQGSRSCRPRLRRTRTSTSRRCSGSPPRPGTRCSSRMQGRGSSTGTRALSSRRSQGRRTSPFDPAAASGRRPEQGGSEEDTGQGIWRISGGNPTLVANLFEYEEKVNPHPATVDSNPFDVADIGGGKAVVADAGGNSVLLVGDGNDPNSDVVSRVKLIATLPDSSSRPRTRSRSSGVPPALPTSAGCRR